MNRQQIEGVPDDENAGNILPSRMNIRPSGTHSFGPKGRTDIFNDLENGIERQFEREESNRYKRRMIMFFVFMVLFIALAFIVVKYGRGRVGIVFGVLSGTIALIFYCMSAFSMYRWWSYGC